MDFTTFELDSCGAAAPLGMPCHGGRLRAVYFQTVEHRTTHPRKLPSVAALLLCEVGLLRKNRLCVREEIQHEVLNEVTFRCSIEQRDVNRYLPPVLLHSTLFLAGSKDGRVLEVVTKNASIEAWMFVTCWSLNHLYRGHRRASGSTTLALDQSTACRRKRLAAGASLQQQKALEQLRSCVVGFFLMQKPPVPNFSWESSLSQVKLDYSGQEIKLPEAVTWEQTDPAPRG